MYQKLMHNKSLRLIGGLLGGLLLSVAINVFIVPQGLYGGGAYGLCQVIRTLLQRELSLSLPFDLAGVLYFFVNIPLFLLAYKALGREFFWKAAICTVCNSVFLAVIPSPSTPVIPDLLTSCMVGGILAGFASGLVLTCGCSTGGLDILGLYLSKKGSRFTVGRFSISFNALLYTLCFFLFDAATAIYSAIYNVLSSLFLDRIHRQNVTVQLLIFTKKNDPQLPRYIMEQLDRGVTSWTGRGGWTGDEVQVLLGVLEGGGDLDGRPAFIPQVCGHTHQQTLAEADIGAVHEEDVVHVGQVCGQLRTLIGAGQLMGQEDAQHLVPGSGGVLIEPLEQLRAGLAGGGQLVTLL